MSTELNITPSTEQHPAPLCGRADPDLPQGIGRTAVAAL